MKSLAPYEGTDSALASISPPVRPRKNYLWRRGVRAKETLKMEASCIAVRKLVVEQRFGVLCTAQPDGQPYTSLVAVVACEDLGQMAFATLRATRKFENISSEPRVALLLDDRANHTSDLMKATTVTVLGRTREVADSERERWITALLSKHATLADFFHSPDCAVVVIEVDRLLLVTEFQRVIELVVRDGVLTTRPSVPRP